MLDNFDVETARAGGKDRAKRQIQTSKLRLPEI